VEEVTAVLSIGELLDPPTDRYRLEALIRIIRGRPPEYHVRLCGVCDGPFWTTHVTNVDVCIEHEIWAQQEIDFLFYEKKETKHEA
jgi:hypothetical protein